MYIVYKVFCVCGTLKKSEETNMKKDYFGLSRLVSLILVIIPFTSWLCGAFTRLSEGKIVAGIIRLIGLGFILWIVDIVLMVTDNHILRLLDC